MIPDLNNFSAFLIICYLEGADDKVLRGINERSLYHGQICKPYNLDGKTVEIN